jgi:hypothetical protein
MRRLCSGFAKDLHDVVRIMEPLGCWRRFFRRDVDHIRPGRNSRRNAPSSVPTALLTARGGMFLVSSGGTLGRC